MEKTLSPGEARGMPHRTRVAILDDHAAVRLGLERVIRREPRLLLVGAAANARDVSHLLASEEVDVAVVDYELSEGNGLVVCQRLKQRPNPPAVLVYSAYAGPGLMVPAAIAQADAVINKAEPVSELLDAIRRVARGERLLPPLPPELMEAAQARLDVDDLPIVAMLISGATLPEIAETLALEVSDVARRARRIIGRLHARTARVGTARR
jgi:DNA-binding NarL/FixJ family response regulator